jgi:hypothetical protein
MALGFLHIDSISRCRIRRRVRRRFMAGRRRWPAAMPTGVDGAERTGKRLSKKLPTHLTKRPPGTRKRVILHSSLMPANRELRRRFSLTAAIGQWRG